MMTTKMLMIVPIRPLFTVPLLSGSATSGCQRRYRILAHQGSKYLLSLPNEGWTSHEL